MTRSKYAQNRIDYITYGNPAGVRALLRKHGYDAPGNLHHRAQAVKELVQRKGQRVVRDLVAIHPDKKVIMKLQPQEDHFCGPCGYSAFTGKHHQPDVSDKEQRYREALAQSNADPEDTMLADKVQATWNALQESRKVREEESEEPAQPMSGVTLFSPQGVTVLGAVLLTGIVVGATLKTCS